MAANRYIDNPNKLLSETYRVLKPGGVFLWPLFDFESFTSLKNLKMLVTLNPERLRQQALQAGYKDVKTIKSGLKVFELMLKKLLQPEYIPNFVIAIK